MLSGPAAILLSTRALNHLAGLIRRHRGQLQSSWRRLDPGRQALLALAHPMVGDGDPAPQRRRNRDKLTAAARARGAGGRREPGRRRGPAAGTRQLSTYRSTTGPRTASAPPSPGPYTLARLACGFQIGVSTAWRHVREAVELLAATADVLDTAMTRIRVLAYAILDGTLIPIDRVADEKPYYSGCEDHGSP